MKTTYPQLVAHRGNSRHAPENTMAAFEQAILHGADMIELDVHLSCDNTLMVTHDYILGRTVSKSGVVGDWLADELKIADAGSWFSPHWSNQGVPLLEDVLDLALGKTAINIEVKTQGIGAQKTTYALMAQSLSCLLSSKEQLPDLIISSFDPRFLKSYRHLDSKTKLGLIDEDLIDGPDLMLAKELKCFSYHPCAQKCTQKDLGAMLDANLKVYPWTINDPVLAQKFLDWGASGIMTSDVVALKPLFHGV